MLSHEVAPLTGNVITPNGGLELVFNSHNLVILTGSANPKLAHAVANILDTQIDESTGRFGDGEVNVKINPNLRRRQVVIIQPTSPPHVNDNLMELLLMIDAAKRGSGAEISVVIPYFGYGRKDRKDRPRVPISAALVASLIKTAGADRIMTVNIHAEQAQGFFPGPWDNLYAGQVLIPELKSIDPSTLVVGSPDIGGVKNAINDARALGASGLAIVFKERDLSLTDTSRALGMIGDVEGKNVLFSDDMIDMAGTITEAAFLAKERGANDIYAIAPHGLFVDPALDRISASPIKRIYVTDSIAHRPEVLNHPKITVVTIAPLLAEAIKRNMTGESISQGLIHKAY